MKPLDAPGTRIQLIVDAMVAMEFRTDFQGWFTAQEVLDEIMEQNKHRHTLIAHYRKNHINSALIRLADYGCVSKRQRQGERQHEYQIHWKPEKWENRMASPWKRAQIAFSAAGYKHKNNKGE